MRLLALMLALILFPAAAAADCAGAAAYSAAHKGISFLVLQDGKVLCEDYPNGGSPSQRHELASGTKSFTGLMAAAAVQDGLLSLDEPVSKTLTEWASDDRRTVTIRQLLTLTSGIETDRPRLGRVPSYADAAKKPLKHPPETKFAYGPTPFQIWGEIMSRKLKAKGETPLAYLDRRILKPIGVTGYEWKKGPDGNAIMPHGAQLTARQWAQFGEFVRGGGKVNGKPIVDPAALSANFAGTSTNPAYGLTWWLAKSARGSPAEKDGIMGRASDFQSDLEAFPPDMVMAAGAGDQRLYISWEEKLVVVRQASGIGAAMMGNRSGFSDAALWRELMR